MRGLSLKVSRIEAGVIGLDIARELGVSAGRVSQIEKKERVSQQWAERYYRALLSIQSRGRLKKGRVGERAE